MKIHHSKKQIPIIQKLFSIKNKQTLQIILETIKKDTHDLFTFTCICTILSQQMKNRKKNNKSNKMETQKCTKKTPYKQQYK